MYASAANLLRAKTGPLGVEMLRRLFVRSAGRQRPSAESGLVTRLLHERPQMVANWLTVPLDRRERIDPQLFKTLTSVEPSVVAADLGLDADEVVRMLDRALYQAVQMAAPGGLRVSPVDAMRLDRDLVALATSGVR